MAVVMLVSLVVGLWLQERSPRRWWRLRRDRWHLGLDGECWDAGCATHRASSVVPNE